MSLTAPLAGEFTRDDGCKVYTVAGFAFVPVTRGVWLRTHPCVLTVACPNCGAEVGYPCIGRRRLPIADTCWVRRRAASAARE